MSVFNNKLFEESKYVTHDRFLDNRFEELKHIKYVENKLMKKISFTHWMLFLGFAILVGILLYIIKLYRDLNNRVKNIHGVPEDLDDDENIKNYYDNKNNDNDNAYDDQIYEDDGDIIIDDDDNEDYHDVNNNTEEYMLKTIYN